MSKLSSLKISHSIYSKINTYLTFISCIYKLIFIGTFIDLYLLTFMESLLERYYDSTLPLRPPICTRLKSTYSARHFSVDKKIFYFAGAAKKISICSNL